MPLYDNAKDTLQTQKSRKQNHDKRIRKQNLHAGIWKFIPYGTFDLFYLTRKTQLFVLCIIYECEQYC